jgi:hypothetical protein
MKEIWKDIAGYEGFYQVSNYGRVKSLKRTVISKKGQRSEVDEKILKPVWRCRNADYSAVHLCRNSKMTTASVHRLVAIAFIPNPNNLPFINHKDENPRNNHVSNLEWCDLSYNNNYGNANIKRSKALINDKAKSKPVYQYSLDGKYIATYPSTMEAERQTGANHIPDVCNGRRGKSGGYVWKYA